MFNHLTKTKIPDDILYEIFKKFILDNDLSCICCVNTEWQEVINNRLMITHLRNTIQNIQDEKNKLEIENYLLKKNNDNINLLYEDLLDTVEQFMDDTGM